MATATKLVTVEEFLAMPEPSTGGRLELHHGEVFEMTQPKFKHVFMSDRLRELLKERLKSVGYVATEFPFRALPEHDCRAADVGFITHERFRGIDHEDNLAGAPDLVVEVLSPSNTAAEMMDREQLCLENGAVEFWMVNLDKRTIHVASRTAASKLYRSGDTISLAAFGGGNLSVDEVFG